MQLQFPEEGGESPRGCSSPSFTLNRRGDSISPLARMVRPVGSRLPPPGAVGAAWVPAGGWQSPGAARCSSISERPCPGGGFPRGFCAHGQPGHRCFPARLHRVGTPGLRAPAALGMGAPGRPHSGCVRGAGDTPGAPPAGGHACGAGEAGGWDAPGLRGPGGCLWGPGVSVGRDTSRPRGHGDGSPPLSAESGPAPCHR